MASLGHIAVGMAATRLYGTGTPPRRSWSTAVVLWSLLSMLPDADVIGFGLGVRYGDEWGHRGATHSLAFSFALGAAIGLAAPLFRLPAVRTGISASLVLASHALLDTLTDGGLGCALFWPFDLTRYFAPWNPIPVAPIGLGFISPYGLMVATVELLLFAPLLWFALSSRTAAARSDTPSISTDGFGEPRPPLFAGIHGELRRDGAEAQAESGSAPMVRRRRTIVRALLVGVWLIAVWLLTSRDPVRERVVGLTLRDDTGFTADFSEQVLRTVKSGHTEQDVRDRLGAPFYEFLEYPNGPNVCGWVRIEGDSVTSAQPPDICQQRGIEPAVSRAAALQTLGTPAQACWLYSRSPSGRYYRARAVCFENARVTFIVRRWMRDRRRT